LDLGKSKTAAHLRCSDGRPDYTTMVNTKPQDLHDLIVSTDPTLVIIEACIMTYWVHDLICALGKKVIVTANNGPGWRWKNIRSKTDRSDAAKLIKMHLSEQLEPVHVPDHGVRQWRQLIHHRHELVEDRTRARNRITGLLALHGIPEPEKCTPFTKKWQQQIRPMAKSMDKCGPTELWRGRLLQDFAMLDQVESLLEQTEDILEQLAAKREMVAMLREEPGVGPRLAETMVAVLDDPLRFKSGKQVACYVGLTPRQWHSGETERSGHISKQGDSLLRTLLVEVAWIGQRYNPWMKKVYEEVKRDAPVRSKIAIVAVARRLLVRLWARMRDKAREQQRRAATALGGPAITVGTA
jgi:transposase